jgi:outer membrane protein assembly factor BamB
MQCRHTYNSESHTCIYMIMILLLSVTANSQEQQAHWNRFRGPNGQGIAEAAGIPADVSRESLVLWKTPIAPGYSSPVIWNNRIFFTANESANEKELMTLCVNRETGNIMWRQTVQAQTEAKLHPKNHPASSTPAVDEKHVYVYFGTYGLICYDHEGNKVWDRKLKTPTNRRGMGGCPDLS